MFVINEANVYLYLTEKLPYSVSAFSTVKLKSESTSNHNNFCFLLWCVSSQTILVCCRIVGWLMNSELKGNCKESEVIWGTILIFPWSDWGKQRNTSIKIAGTQADILTGHLSNTKTATTVQICSVRRKDCANGPCGWQWGSPVRRTSHCICLPYGRTPVQWTTDRRSVCYVTITLVWMTLSVMHRSSVSLQTYILSFRKHSDLCKYCVRLRAGGPRGWSSSAGWVKNFLFSRSFRQALGLTQLPIQWVSWIPSQGVKRPGCESDHSPPTSAKVKKNVHLYIHSPIHLHGVVFN
jgi:hypothetical protein